MLLRKFFNDRSVVLLSLFLLLFSCSQSSRYSDQEKEEIRDGITQIFKSITADPDSKDQYLGDFKLENDLEHHLNSFYKSRDYQLAWINLDQPESQAEALLEQIKISYVHGLDSNSYHLEEIKSLRDSLYSNAAPEEDPAKEYVKLDYVFTAAYLTLASHMLEGVINPEIADSNWVHYKKEKEWDVYLKNALENNEIEKSITSLVPKNEQYALLKDKLAAFRDLAESNNIPANVPADISIALGDSSKVVGILKERLAFWGDLDKNVTEGGDFNVYDEKTEKAIADFQSRHGILEDGKVGPETIQMLNASVDSRMEQISLNMERLRWLPESLSEHYVWINIPDYQLKIVNKGKEDLKMKVIVGEKMNETPIFSDTMEYIVFSPTWTVPKSISTEEMLPKIKEEEEDYFEDKNLLLFESWAADAKKIDPRKVNWRKVDKEDFQYKIVEKPSATNALGLVKFMFPNSEAIYLHDTPTDHLFDRTERGFSHGCIRVEKPRDLAKYLLQENEEDWDPEKITEYMELDTPTTVTLSQRLPVHIVYHSAWVDENNRIHFRKDIYKHDKTQEQAIERKEDLLM